MLEGSCLCGTVRFAIEGRVTPIQLCHCARCRKSTGGPYEARLACRTRAFRFLAGQEHVRSWTAPVREEPPGYLRTFCDVCGASVPAWDPDAPYASIPAGTLDGDPGARPFRHIFVDRKAPWHEITDELPRFALRPPPEQRLPRKGEG